MNDWLEAEGHADRAFEMFERGRWAEAESELRKALALNPDQAEWHFNLGLTLEACGRDAEALAAYRRALELMPGELDPLLAAAIAANRLDQPLEALRWLDEALQIDRDNESAYAQKMEAHYRLGDHDSVETTYYLAQQALDDLSPSCLAVVAESLIDRQEWERAGWCLREAMRRDPAMPRLRARLGLVLAETGHPQRALQMYLRDLRDDPGNTDTLLDFGDLLIQLGRLPEAAEKFRRVLELEPANVDAHAQLGHVAMRMGRYEQAHLEFELVLKLDADFPSIRMDLGESLLRRGRITAARECLEQLLRAIDAMDEGEQDHLDFARLGDLLLEVELPNAAATMIERAIVRDGESSEVLRQLALARFLSGERDAGVVASRRVLRREPNCIRSIHNLALASLQTGQHRLAAGWVWRGLQISPQDDGLRRLRVRIWLARLGRYFGVSFRAARGLVFGR